MQSTSQAVTRVFAALLVVSAAAGLLAAGCSEIQPEPNDEGGGMVQSPTAEQDELREDEDRGDRGEEGGRR